MADKEKIQDTAAESVTGGTDFGDIAKAVFGKNGNKVVASLSDTAAQLGKVVVEAAQMKNGVTGVVAPNLKAESEKNDADNAVGITPKKNHHC